MAKVSVAEAQFAYYFLQKLGGNVNNTYLITAVVAWMRAESGGLSRVIGNNPFNIRESKYAVSYRYPKGNGRFSVFASLKMGAYAAADMLIRAGSDWRRYDRIVKAARSAPKTAKGQQDQGHSFIIGVVISAWDAGRYHLGPGANSIADYNDNNLLFRTWAGITGVPSFTIPAEPTGPTPEQIEYEKRKKRPKPPPPLAPPSTHKNLVYLDPYEARGFYRATRPADDMGNLIR
jgi:hypothetical protein